MKSAPMRRWLFAGFTFLFAAASQAQPVSLKIQDYPGIVGTLVRVAIEKGYCEQQGLKCSLNTIPSAPLGLQTLLAGGIDVSLPPAEVVIQSAVKGANLKIVSASFTASPFMLIMGKGMMGSAGKSYPQIMHDLKGKKIGITARGAAPEFQVKTMLKGAGMKDDDVTFVAVGSPNTGYPALLNQQVDAVMSFVPFDGLCSVLETCRVAVTPAKGEGPEELVALNGGGGLYVMRQDFVSKHKGVDDAFFKAMTDAGKFASDPANLDELLKITLKYYKMDAPRGEEILRNSLERFQFAFVPDVKPESIQAAADYLKNTGQINKPFDTKVLF